MASNVVNLNRFRKKKLRDAKSNRADINRVRHGRTGAQKAQELADRERATRLLEGKRLEEGTDDESAPPADATEE